MIVAAVAVAGGGRGEEGAVPLGSNDRAVLVTVEPHTHSHTEPLTIITKNVNKDPVPASQHAVPTCIHRWSILSPPAPAPPAHSVHSVDRAGVYTRLTWRVGHTVVSDKQLFTVPAF